MVDQEKKKYELIVGPLFPLENIEEAQAIVHHKFMHLKLGHITGKIIFLSNIDKLFIANEREVENELFKIYGEKSRKIKKWAKK